MNRDWFYNEFKQTGVDYSKNEIADDYDNQHNDFRDYAQEVNDFLAELDLNNTKELCAIDLGCGTGAFSINASKYFKKIYAVDVSPAMLEVAKGKATKENISNIEFVNAGFITYQHEGVKADLLITKYAFHHFSDFWKQVALFNMNMALKMGGTLYIHDVVFQFNPTAYETKIENWIKSYQDKLAPDFIEEFKVHIRDEFSTFDWILRGLIERAGFDIMKVKSQDEFSSEYFCQKTREISTE